MFVITLDTFLFAGTRGRFIFIFVITLESFFIAGTRSRLMQPLKCPAMNLTVVSNELLDSIQNGFFIFFVEES